MVFVLFMIQQNKCAFHFSFSISYKNGNFIDQYQSLCVTTVAVYANLSATFSNGVVFFASGPSTVN